MLGVSCMGRGCWAERAALVRERNASENESEGRREVACL